MGLEAARLGREPWSSFVTEFPLPEIYSFKAVAEATEIRGDVRVRVAVSDTAGSKEQSAIREAYTLNPIDRTHFVCNVQSDYGVDEGGDGPRLQQEINTVAIPKRE